MVMTMVGKGRKKVEISLIKDPSSRMVCFSKRRKGLFKKAEELSILSGAKIAVLAFSHAGKLYCSDTKIMDSLLYPQLHNSSEIQREDCWNSSFSEARAAETLPDLHSEIPLEHVSDSSFAGAMVEQRFSSDVPTVNSLLCPQLNISTENDAGDGWNYAFTEAMDANLYCSNAATLNPPLCPQLEIYTEQGEENCGEFDFAAARAAESLLCPQFEMPLENVFHSSFAGAMVEEPFSSDVPTTNSTLCPPLNISTENDAGDGWNCAFTEAMGGNIYCSNAATLNPPLCPQLDIYMEQEEEFDFAEARAADSLLLPQFEMPLEKFFASSFVGAMAEEPFSSDVPTPDSLLYPQLKISTVNDAGDNGWNYAFSEPMDGNLYYSDAATLNPLLRPQFDIATA